MKIRINLKSLFLLVLLFGFFSSKPAHADTFTLSGNVSKSSGSVVAGATISALNSDTNVLAGTTTTDSSGNYTLILSNGSYNVQATPLAGSGFSSAIALTQNVFSNTVLNFILTPVGTVRLSGNLYDALNNPVANQTVRLKDASGSIITSTTTNSSGSYTLESVTGNYTLEVVSPSSGNSLLINVPQQLLLKKTDYSLSQTTYFDIHLPLKKVDIQVNDQNGSSVSNVEIKATANDFGNFQDLSIGGGIIDASGLSDYGQSFAGPKTNSTGKATIWLFPNDSSRRYAITAVPPTGSNAIATTLAGILISADTQETITLQQPISLNGHIYDALGNPVVNQTVRLRRGDGSTAATSTTNPSGNYILSVSSGTYTFEVLSPSNGNSFSLNIPQALLVRKSDYVLTQNTSLDINLPLKKVDIHVQNSAGSPVSGAPIDATANDFGNFQGLSIGGGITDASGLSDYGQGLSKPTTDANGNLTLWLFPNDASHSYTINASSPANANYSVASLTNVKVHQNMNLTITLTQPVTFSGHIYDAQGNPVQNQIVRLLNNGDNSTVAQATTNSAGYYSIQTSSGAYTLAISSPTTGNSLSSTVPQYLQIRKLNYALNQDTVLDITLPLKKIDIHIQDAFNNPVSGVSIKATANDDYSSQSLSIGGNITEAWGLAEYGTNGFTAPQTNSSGNATLWLFTTENNRYTFTATPPNGSIYSTFTLNSVSITGNQNELISLQYNHAAPITTIDLQTQHTDGTYSNPTTVTLSATAAAGYTIGTTYYKVDGGSQQTYNTPFTVTSTGEHTIEYWSVDNSGVQEAHNTKNFTIHTNQPPHVNPLNGGSINANDTYTEGGSFTDDDSTSWTATVDYGDGTGTQDLPLQAAKTFTLSHQYTTAGNYTINVTVTDNQGATGTTYASVTVNNAPQVASFSGATMLSGEVYSENGSFVDSDSSSWTATVNYGDSSGDQPLTLSGKTFSLNHTYATPGSYTVTVKVTDNQGAIGTGIATVTVNNRPPHVNPLNGRTVNEGGTYTENGSFTDADSSSWTATVDYGDGTGQQPLSLNTDKTFSFNHTYKDNGNYTVTVVVTDNQGNTGTTMTSVTVNNVTPTVYTISVTPNPTHINSSTSASASFTDPGVLDTHTATIDWGDGSATQNATVSETNGSGTVSGSHTYTTFGTYTVTVSVRDKDNATAQKTTNLTVVKQLTALTPAKIYVSRGLPTIRLDLKAEVYKDTTLVSSGESASVAPGLGATLESIPFNTFTPVDVPSGSALKVVVYARNACSGSILNSGTATLSYNNTSVDSSFGATIGTTSATYHLLNGFVLGTTAGNSTQTVSVQAGAQCSAFKSFGTWTVTP